MIFPSKKVFITNSFEETQKLGEKFARSHLARQTCLSGCKLIALYGDLGSGKTTFVQGMARGLGVKRRIISPTFIIIRSYKIKNQPFDFAQGKKSKIKYTNKKLKMFYHIDLYRMESNKDIGGLGLDEIIKNEENIVMVEWAEKMDRLLPKKRIDIQFVYVSEHERKITIKKLT